MGHQKRLLRVHALFNFTANRIVGLYSSMDGAVAKRDKLYKKDKEVDVRILTFPVFGLTPAITRARKCNLWANAAQLAEDAAKASESDVFSKKIRTKKADRLHPCCTPLR